MKSTLVIALFVFLAALSNSEYATTEKNIMYSDTSSKCPVTGDLITAEYVSYTYIDKDQKFCNDGCMMAFKKEPAKYTEHLMCMPCGDTDAKQDLSTMHNGVKYYFCGKGCKGKFEAEPEAYLKQFTK